MFSPGPRFFGAGGLQELQLASVNEGHSALDFREAKCCQGLQAHHLRRSSPEEEACMRVKRTPLKLATATVEEKLRGRVWDLVLGPKNGPRKGSQNTRDLQLDA